MGVRWILTVGASRMCAPLASTSSASTFPTFSTSSGFHVAPGTARAVRAIRRFELWDSKPRHSDTMPEICASQHGNFFIKGQLREKIIDTRHERFLETKSGK